MQLPQPGEHCLAGLGIVPHGQRRILLDQVRQRRRQPSGVGCPAGLHGHRDHRIRHHRRLEDQWVAGLAEGGADPGGLRPGDRDDVTGDRTVHFGVPVGLDPQDPGDPFGAAGTGIPHCRSLPQRSRVHPQVGQPARSGRDHLEHQRGERRRRVGGPFPRRTVLSAAHRRHVQGRGQVGHDGVQQRLDPAVAVGRAAQHHEAVAAAGEVAKRGGQRLRGHGPLRAELLQRRRMKLGNRFLQQSAAPVRLVPQHVRHRAFVGRFAPVGPDQRPQAQQVDDAGESVLPSDRQLHHERRRMQPPPDRVDSRIEFGTCPVQLVDERDPRHPMPVGLPPYRFALRLDARHGVEHRDRAVEDPQ